MHSSTNKEEIVLYLLFSQDKYKKINEPYKKQLDYHLNTNDPVFHDEIKEQYKDLIKSLILNQMSKDIFVNPQEAMEVLDDLNLDEYLK